MQKCNCFVLSVEMYLRSPAAVHQNISSTYEYEILINSFFFFSTFYSLYYIFTLMLKNMIYVDYKLK